MISGFTNTIWFDLIWNYIVLGKYTQIVNFMHAVLPMQSCGEPCTIIACEPLSLSGVSFYTQSWQYHLLLINLLTSAILQLFVEHFTTFSVFLCPCLNFFWNISQASISELVSLEMKEIAFLLYSTKYKIDWKGFANHYILFLFISHRKIMLLGIGVFSLIVK